MNKFTKEDIDLLYWHAVGKMRQGSFRSAYQFFNYVFELSPSFHNGLAKAYCAYRDGHLDLAQEALDAINPSTPREERFYNRLSKRVSR